MPIPLGIFATAGAGGGAITSFDHISTTILGADASTVTFSSIPQNYQHLQLRWACRTGSGASTIYLQVYLNSDTGANYNGHAFFANGTNVYNENYTPTNSINAKYGSVSNAVGAWGVGVMDFLDYANTTKNKTTRSLNGSWYGSADRGVVLSSGLWRNTSGISSITIFANGGNGSWQVAAGSRFSLYGLKG